MPPTGSSFSVVTEITPSERRVVPRGDLDMTARPAVDAALVAAEAGPDGSVVLDLRGIDFMDSTGVHVAVDAERRCRARGVHLRLVRGPERVQRLFRMTDTEARLPFAAA